MMQIAIVKWFSNKKKYGHNYVLHETNVGTVQIMNYDVHRMQTHSGGTSLEKNNLINASGIRNQI